MGGITELAEKIDAAGTRADFAKSVGISQGYLSRILSGKSPLSRLPFQTVLRISEKAGIPTERLGADENGRARRRAIR
jgi:transcriptional regulator with XRE-family HTH domain